jgi:hypothetical protein
LPRDGPYGMHAFQYRARAEMLDHDLALLKRHPSRRRFRGHLEPIEPVESQMQSRDPRALGALRMSKDPEAFHDTTNSRTCLARESGFLSRPFADERVGSDPRNQIRRQLGGIGAKT